MVAAALQPSKGHAGIAHLVIAPYPAARG
jgi:hypothetical protein